MATPQQTTSLERLQEELAQKSEEVSVLRQMSSEVNATLNLDEIYEAVLGTMYDLFGFHHSLILLLSVEESIVDSACRQVGDNGNQGFVAFGEYPPVGTLNRENSYQRIFDDQWDRNLTFGIRKSRQFRDRP